MTACPQILWVPISEVKPNPDNPRIIKDANFKKLVQSIKDFPQMLRLRPCVVNNMDEKIVLGGNQRLEAAKAAGLEKITVIDGSFLTEDQQKEFIVKDNISYGEWDWNALANGWSLDQLDEWALEIPDFKDDRRNAQEDNYEMPDDIQTDIEEGDFFQIGDHRLLCGDSTDPENWQKLCKNQLLDIIITDPPYNVDYTGKTKASLKIKNDNLEEKDFFKFLLKSFSASFPHIRDGGSQYVWHADTEGANFRLAFTHAGYRLSQVLIWKKNVMVMGRQDYHWQHEPCLYGWKPGAGHKWYSDRTQTTVLEFDRPTKSESHPTMKPILLLAYLLENSSQAGDFVGDGFLGSGSTMIAAHQLGRICYGMELDPKYCQVVLERCTKWDSSIQIFRNGKPYHISVKAA